MYEPKDMSGTLFRNDRKETERQPDYKGNALIAGREFALSGWVKQSKTGGKFLSLVFKPKDTSPAAQEFEAEAEDLPF